MITKATVKDINGNTHTYNWKIYTHSEKIKGKCKECGEPIYKSISFQYQGTPSEEDWKRFEKKKEEWLSQERICNKCLKKAMLKGGNDITNNYTSHFEDLIKIQEDINKLNSMKKSIIETHLKELKDKVVKVDKDEYIINSISTGTTENMPFEMWLSPISKTHPWTTKSGTVFASTDTPYGNSISMSRIVITDENFSDRIEKVREFEKNS